MFSLLANLRSDKSRQALPRTRRPSIFDRDHISETFANIGAAFLSNERSFGAGLIAAGHAMAQRSLQLRDECRLPAAECGGCGLLAGMR